MPYGESYDDYGSDYTGGDGFGDINPFDFGFSDSTDVTASDPNQDPYGDFPPTGTPMPGAGQGSNEDPYDIFNDPNNTIWGDGLPTNNGDNNSSHPSPGQQPSGGSSSGGGKSNPITDALKKVGNAAASPLGIGAIAALLSGLLQQRRHSFSGTSADPVARLGDFFGKNNDLYGQIAGQDISLPDAFVPGELPSFSGGGLPMNIGMSVGVPDNLRQGVSLGRRSAGAAPSPATASDHQEASALLNVLKPSSNPAPAANANTPQGLAPTMDTLASLLPPDWQNWNV